MDKLGANFIVDGLTNSIRNTVSGDSFETEVHRLVTSDLKNVTKKNGWQFSWRAAFNDLARETYKRTIRDNQNIVQGLLSVSYEDDHVFMHLLESAPST